VEISSKRLAVRGQLAVVVSNCLIGILVLVIVLRISPYGELWFLLSLSVLTGQVSFCDWCDGRFLFVSNGAVTSS